MNTVGMPGEAKERARGAPGKWKRQRGVFTESIEVAGTGLIYGGLQVFCCCVVMEWQHLWVIRWAKQNVTSQIANRGNQYGHQLNKMLPIHLNLCHRMMQGLIYNGIMDAADQEQVLMNDLYDS